MSRVDTRMLPGQWTSDNGNAGAGQLLGMRETSEKGAMREMNDTPTTVKVKKEKTENKAAWLYSTPFFFYPTFPFPVINSYSLKRTLLLVVVLLRRI